MARLPTPAQLHGLVTGLPSRGSRRISGLLRAAADRLAGGPAAARQAAQAAALDQAAEATLADARPTAITIGAARALWADRLWEDGCVLPGGVAEIQRLSGLLPLSPATTLLLVGRDAGGAAATIITQRGAWVAAHQHDPLVATRMAPRLRPLGRRAAILPWNPAAPAFRVNYHHHALALEPLAGGGEMPALLAALAAGLKPNAQLVVLELVAGEHAALPNAPMDRWLTLEGRPDPPPKRAAVEAAIQAAGFQLHVAEDAAPRQCAAITEAWARMLGEMRRTKERPSRSSALAMITEAELWLLRHRLLTAGDIGLMRWHATLRR